MPVVSNTSPLLNLAIIGELDRVREQVGTVLVPEAVVDEWLLSTTRPGTAALQQALDEGWVEVIAISNRAMVHVLRRELDQGEAEALTLAVERHASLVLLDEREARRVARTLKVPVTGALGILLRARREGTLGSLQQAMHRLRVEAGFWIAPALEADLLQQVGES
ncbi:MAG: DUF3368 domain-containing protein [Bacteroidota bacterium]